MPSPPYSRFIGEVEGEWVIMLVDTGLVVTLIRKWGMGNSYCALGIFCSKDNFYDSK